MKTRVFKTTKSATAAVKREGLHMMNYVIEPHCSAAGTGEAVRFYVQDIDDFNEITSRGFIAEINREKAAA